jgi:hypothetical protein
MSGVRASHDPPYPPPCLHIIHCNKSYGSFDVPIDIPHDVPIDIPHDLAITLSFESGVAMSVNQILTWVSYPALRVTKVKGKNSISQELWRNGYRSHV